MIGYLVNDEFKGIWKEAVLYQALFWREWGKTRKSPVRLVVSRADVPVVPRSGYKTHALQVEPSCLVARTEEGLVPSVDSVDQLTDKDVLTWPRHQSAPCFLCSLCTFRRFEIQSLKKITVIRQMPVGRSEVEIAVCVTRLLNGFKKDISRNYRPSIYVTLSIKINLFSLFTGLLY
jgi:hypothetical protein